MKKSLSVVASAMLLGGLFMTGCGSNSSSGSSSGSTSGGSTSGGSTSGGSTSGGSTSGGSTSGGAVVTPDSSSITIKGLNNTETAIDPATGGTVITSRNNNGTNSVASVVYSQLNECTDATRFGSRVACGPKEGTTYVFQSDFSKLGPVDNFGLTSDGGVLLYDAQTEIAGQLHKTPTEGNTDENRVEAVYIPTNYIVLDDQAKDDSIQEKYEYMEEYLDDICNMKCMFQEFDAVTDPDKTTADPFFTPANYKGLGNAAKTEGRFVATYVMHFSRGISEENLYKEFAAGNTKNLEYLWVQFELDVVKTDAEHFTFKSPAGTPVVFGGKKHDGDLVMLKGTNDELNILEHVANQDWSGDIIPFNMAKVFKRVMTVGSENGVTNQIGNYAKKILVENATNPWPVKIYGTLHEINATDAGGNPTDYDRSFVRNPAKLDANLFGLYAEGSLAQNPYKDVFKNDPAQKANAQKFVLVYPGGAYNKLD